MRRLLALIHGLPPESAIGGLVLAAQRQEDGEPSSTPASAVEGSQYKPAPEGVTRNIIRPSTADPAVMGGIFA